MTTTPMPKDNEVDEKVIWTTDKPTAEGAYYIRGFNVCRPAAAVVPEGMVLVPRELLWRVLDSVDVNAMADASDELRSILEAQ